MDHFPLRWQMLANVSKWFHDLVVFMSKIHSQINIFAIFKISQLSTEEKQVSAVYGSFLQYKKSSLLNL